jgi:hypothetical protein
VGYTQLFGVYPWTNWINMRDTSIGRMRQGKQ